MVTSPILDRIAAIAKCGLLLYIPSSITACSERDNPILTNGMRCGLSSKLFDHLLNFGAQSMSLEWVKLGISNFDMQIDIDEW